ncbi:hypothetical protein BKA83DRAFT_4322912 [Pisolithus microcarpus]|nr:hypothetical protein BKA83DRAFT_4322912 [Pisolithus microcarpus]
MPRSPSASSSPSQRPRSHRQLSRLRHQNIGLWNPWTGLTGWQLTMWASHIGPTTGTVEDVPAIKVSEHVLDGDPDPMADVDVSTNLRVRSLYPYETQRAEDLHFGENVVIEAHPSKSGGDWWYGTTVNDGRSGFFPQTYVRLEPVKATALYSYEGSSPDELSFTEDDVLTIVNRLESEWGRAEWDGVIYTMPAA